MKAAVADSVETVEGKGVVRVLTIQGASDDCSGVITRLKQLYPDCQAFRDVTVEVAEAAGTSEAVEAIEAIGVADAPVQPVTESLAWITGGLRPGQNIVVYVGEGACSVDLQNSLIPHVPRGSLCLVLAPVASAPVSKIMWSPNGANSLTYTEHSSAPSQPPNVLVLTYSADSTLLQAWRKPDFVIKNLLWDANIGAVTGVDIHTTWDLRVV
jgi:hypothetical protein